MAVGTRSTKSLTLAVLLMTLVVVGLGGSVLVIKLRPRSEPASDMQREIERWQSAVDEAPEDDWAHAGLGMALLVAGRDGEASQEFEEALVWNARNWVALYQLGLIERSSDRVRAADLLERAARYAPRTSKSGPLIALGNLELADGDAEQARGIFRRAIADSPFLIDPHVGLAKALEALGDAEGALEQYMEAARYDPSNPDVIDAIDRLGG